MNILPNKRCEMLTAETVHRVYQALASDEYRPVTIYGSELIQEIEFMHLRAGKSEKVRYAIRVIVQVEPQD